MATLALIIWPLVAVSLFARLGLVGGLLISTLAGYLFLPPQFTLDLPVLPPYDKEAAISIGLLLGTLISARERSEAASALHTGSRLFARIMAILLILLLLNPVFVFLTNRQPLFFGEYFRPGMVPWDIISMTWGILIGLVPYLLARRYLATPEAHRRLLVAILSFGLAYSLLVLFERRMSPQLNVWVYGYFPHSFLQHVRDGWRPIVFLNHGLMVGIFLLAAVLSAFALSRTKDSYQRTKYLIAGVWLFGVLLLSRNLGASMLAVLFVPIILFLSPRQLARTSGVVAIIFLLYPSVRQADILPIEGFTTFVSSISEERAASFQTRMDNERVLLEKALEKPLFGWGSWGRNRIYDEMGRDVSITDGLWVIVIGTQGWVGYVARFGLLCLPVLWLAWAGRRKEIPPETAGLAIIMAATFIDLVPNSGLSPISMLAAGALAGFVQYDPVRKSRSAQIESVPERSGQLGMPRYTRFAPTQPARERISSASASKATTSVSTSPSR